MSPGSTASAAFPNNGALTCPGTKSTGNDAFVAKLVPSGASVGYCRFIGGSGDDVGQAIATDAFGNVWVAGSTTSTSIQPLTRNNIASNVTVDFATVDGTATALSDYVATTGTVSFAAGQMSQRITIPLQIEPGAQPTRSFGVVLSNIRGGAILGPFVNAEVRIVDTK
jgi:Calx-beta domain/Beta-propeller repeat